MSLKSPAFQFYPSDFLADENQIVMDLDEVGAYIRLIAVCWNEGSLPKDVRRLAKLCGATHEQMERIWPALEPCFEECSQDAARLVHPRLERERLKQETYREKMSEAGRKGAKVRKSGRSKGGQKPAKSQDVSSQATSQASTGLKPKVSSSTRELSSSFMFSASAEFPETPGNSKATAAGGSRNGKSTPTPLPDVPWHKAVRPPFDPDELPATVDGVAQMAGAMLGMGSWSDAKLEETRGLIRRRWHKKGVPLERLKSAIRGVRILVDRGEISWLADRAHQPIDGLEVLLKNAVAGGSDGEFQASLFAHAERAWHDGGKREKATRGGGAQRVSVGVMPPGSEGGSAA
jgi:uncharacterized protein YdaU (DUF1376 family)